MTVQRIAAVALAFVLLVGACSDDDADDASESVDLPDGAAAVVDDYRQAVAVDHDGDAMLAVVTEDFEFVDADGENDAGAWATSVDLLFDDFAVEQLSEATVVGEGDEYLLSQAERVTGSGVDMTGFTVMRVVDVDGTWLIDHHEFIAVN